MEFIHIFWFHEKNENANVENNYLYIYTFYFEGEVMCNESETHLVMLLNQLCSRLQENPALLEVFFKPPGSNVSSRFSSSKPDQFIIFSILLRFLHTEGVVGGQARDALLLCMALSETHEGIGEYITGTNFCHVRWIHFFLLFFPWKNPHNCWIFHIKIVCTTSYHIVFDFFLIFKKVISWKIDTILPLKSRYFKKTRQIIFLH